jgi:hypothetical protein
MYYGSNKQWYICHGREAMEAGKAAGLMRVNSTALTPAQVTETWQVFSPGDGKWVDARKVRARMCSAEEKCAAAERLEQERQQAQLRESEQEQERQQAYLRQLEQERQQAMEGAAAQQVRDIHMFDWI